MLSIFFHTFYAILGLTKDLARSTALPLTDSGSSAGKLHPPTYNSPPFGAFKKSAIRSNAVNRPSALFS